ncbi:MAG: hypothetical protein V5A39_07355 [Haloarculaceae archaeon]
MASRRGLLQRLAALSGAAGLAGCSGLLGRQTTAPVADLQPNPLADELPDRQHAWDDTLPTDADGNHLAPRHYRVLLLDLDEDPTEAAAATVERAMRTLESAYDYGPDGLLHMLAWGTTYFDRLGSLDSSPIRRPKVLSRTDNPDLRSYDAALVLATNVPSHLSAADGAMFGTRSSLKGVTVDETLGEVFSVTRRKTGFLGEGLPAEHAAVEGVPSDVSGDAPMFTGFFSGRARTQAGEGRITISDGPHAGGTTMHLSHLTESLGTWWNMATEDRVARMFSSEFSPEDVAELGQSMPFADAVREHASDGDVGHWEKVRRAREDGKPLLLRRDFNTTDGRQAGVHFLSLQRQLEDFEKTRDAMNGWWLREEHSDLKDRANNGILEFITVVSRANFYVPPRSERVFPDG